MFPQVSGPTESLPKARATWGLGDAAVGWVLSLFVSNTVAVAAIAVTAGHARSLTVLLAGQFGLWLVLAGVPIYASIRKGTGSLGEDFGLRARPTDALFLVVGVACQLALVPAVYIALRPLIGEPDVSGAARDLAEVARGAHYLLLSALVVLVAPIIEELFYRGLLLRAAVKRFGTPLGFALASSVFAASHFQVLQFPGLLAFAAILSGLALWTRRLGPGIAAHVAFNAVTMAALAPR